MFPVNLDKLKPGMVLAKPVHSLHGVLLLNDGTKITKKNIWVLKSWGVTEVWVEGEFKKDEDSHNKSESEERKSIEKELREKFSEALEDEVMAEIMRVAIKQLEKRIQKKDGKK